MKVGSLYSGAVDAFACAAKALDMEVCWQVEMVKEYHRYLNMNYPESEKHYYDGAIGKQNLQRVHIICGGDPCQPHSLAGIRRGTADDRYRWPEMFRIIRELRPDWVINENVTGTVSNLVLDQKAADLESVGYTCRAFAVPAVGVGACHLRERVFLIANADAQRREGALCFDRISLDKAFEKANPLDTQGNPFLRFTESVGEPAVFAVDDGIPGRVLRLGAAGDTIVSTIPVILLGAIKEIEKQIK